MLKHRAGASESGKDESSAGASGAGQYAGAVFTAVSAPFGSTVFFSFRIFSLVLLMPPDLQVRRRGGPHYRSFSHTPTSGTNSLGFSRAYAERLPRYHCSCRVRDRRRNLWCALRRARGLPTTATRPSSSTTS